MRFKLFVLMSFFSTSTLILAHRTYSTFEEFRKSRQTIESTNAQQAKDLKPLLESALRGDTHEFRQRQALYVKNAENFQSYQHQQLDYLENRLSYFGTLMVANLMIGFFILQVFVNFGLIRPLKNLSQRMTDFVNDRYTYQFTVPSTDEIGQMHSTFNTMAQRVLSNMEQLRTLDQAKSEFLSIASHELRTPLTSIKGSLTLMRGGVVGPMNEMADNLLEIAETETDRLIRLINDILDLAKIEAQRLSLNQDWRPLKPMIENCLKSLNGLAQQAEIQLHAEIPPSIEAHIDSDRIQQVLTNLISNAIKFSPRGKAIFVRCEIQANHEIRIEVRDQGRGIAPQDQEAIFEKFRQATSASNPLVKGTGLGLAIAKALVEQHQGKIGVKSIPGDGSTFFFTLPEWRYCRQIQMEAVA